MANCCFIRQDGRFVKVPFSAIRFIEAHKNYPRIYLQSHSLVALITLKHLEAYLPPEQFCRIHRSYIVALEHLTAFDAHQVYVGERALPLARHYQKTFYQKLLILDGQDEAPGAAVPFARALTLLQGSTGTAVFSQ